MDPTIAQKLEAATASILTLTTERDALKASVEKLTADAKTASEAHVKELDGLKAEATTLREQVKAANEKADKAEKSASAKAAEIAAAAGHPPVASTPSPDAPGATTAPAVGSVEHAKKVHADFAALAKTANPTAIMEAFEKNKAILSKPCPQ